MSITRLDIYNVANYVDKKTFMSKSTAEIHKLYQFEKSKLPLHGIAVDYQKGHIIAAHKHNHSAQLMYSISGTLLIETQTGRWLVPPNRAVWLGAGEEHCVIMRTRTQVRSLLVKATVIDSILPNNSFVINVTPLLKELIKAATSLPINYTTDKRANLLVGLLLEELKHHHTLKLLLPWPKEARYQNVCEYLTHHLTDSRPIAQWANELHISAKTFERQFVQLTGISFGKWRQQARLLYSIEALNEGRPITDIAFNYGYNSHSAYSAAFKAFFGQCPSDFMKENSG